MKRLASAYTVICGIGILAAASCSSSSSKTGDTKGSSSGSSGTGAMGATGGSGTGATSTGGSGTGATTSTGGAGTGGGGGSSCGGTALSSTTPNVAQPGTAIVSRGQVIDLAPGAINGAVLDPKFASVGAVHYATTPVQWNYDPVNGLVKVATGEYFTALLMSDGSVQVPNGDVNGPHAVTPLTGFPAGTTIKDAAGGMHNGVFLDSTGMVWTVGTSWGGFSLSGDGTGSNSGALVQIQHDVTNAPFKNVVSVQAGANASAAIKSDGSLWIWGNCAAGLAGDGTNGGQINSPTRVPFPNGVQIKQIVFSDIAIALDTNGGVWTWGQEYAPNLGRTLDVSYMSPDKVLGLPSNVVSVSAGSGNYALTSDGKLYGWGYAGDHLGAGTTTPWPPADAPQGVGAVALQQYLNLPNPVQAVAANGETTHVILSDGSLWGWGDDAYGGVGDGQELDYSKTPDPYGFDWGKSELMIYKPIQLAKDACAFKAIYKNNVAAFYTFAVTADGHVYTWGRNKTGNLMNGIVEANPIAGAISAALPNSWDVLVPMKVNPLQYKVVEVSSTQCLLTPTNYGCQTYDIATGKDQ